MIKTLWSLVGLSLAFWGCAGTRAQTPLIPGAKVSFEVGPNTNATISSLILCPEVLRLIPASGSPVEMELPQSDIDVTSSRVRLATPQVAFQDYQRVELQLGTGCTSQKSVSVVNSQGTFNAGQTVTLTFAGAFSPAQSSKVVLGLQPIVDQVAGVSANAQLLNAATAASGLVTATAVMTAGKKHVFITSTTYSGNLGGLSGGDANCAAAADSSGYTGASWKAWLSDSTADAINRINDVGPWYLADGSAVVFANKAAIISSYPAVPLHMTERGAEPAEPRAWTGTSNIGTHEVFIDCQGWTTATFYNGLYGESAQTGSAWTMNAVGSAVSCGNSYALYCFEQ